MNKQNMNSTEAAPHASAQILAANVAKRLTGELDSQTPLGHMTQHLLTGRIQAALEQIEYGARCVVLVKTPHGTPAVVVTVDGAALHVLGTAVLAGHMRLLSDTLSPAVLKPIGLQDDVAALACFRPSAEQAHRLFGKILDAFAVGRPVATDNPDDFESSEPPL